jgi:hypothetical protein
VVNKRFEVVVEYDGMEHDDALFAMAERVLGEDRRHSNGSGYGFGRRDHTWCDLTRTQAEKLAVAIKLVNAPNLQVKVRVGFGG